MDKSNTEHGVTWHDYVHAVVESEGGWRALIDSLYLRGRDVVDLPVDPSTIEKGLRRLSKKGNESGGQYGRWLVRFFPVPTPIATWAKWVGQYHSRFSDLPIALRREQLRLLERPPLTESPAAIWIHLGFASLFFRALDHDAMHQRMALAERIHNPDPEAIIENLLFHARLFSDSGDAESCEGLLESVEKKVDALPIGESRDAYFARCVDQKTYQLLHHSDVEPNYQRALELYSEIPTTSSFTSFRRAIGLGYVHWKLGDIEDARHACNDAISAAGDGGFVRLRVMALNMMSRIIDEPANGPFRVRATKLAAKLQDEELMTRILKP